LVGRGSKSSSFKAVSFEPSKAIGRDLLREYGADPAGDGAVNMSCPGRSAGGCWYAGDMPRCSMLPARGAFAAAMPTFPIGDRTIALLPGARRTCASTPEGSASKPTYASIMI
jgi:hypothetical protein